MYDDIPVIVLGTTWLKKFYTVFDAQNNQVGFAKPKSEFFSTNGCKSTGIVNIFEGWRKRPSPVGSGRLLDNNESMSTENSGTAVISDLHQKKIGTENGILNSEESNGSYDVDEAQALPTNRETVSGPAKPVNLRKKYVDSENGVVNSRESNMYDVEAAQASSTNRKRTYFPAIPTVGDTTRPKLRTVNKTKKRNISGKFFPAIPTH